MSFYPAAAIPASIMPTSIMPAPIMEAGSALRQRAGRRSNIQIGMLSSCRVPALAGVCLVAMSSILIVIGASLVPVLYWVACFGALCALCLTHIAGKSDRGEHA